jgi:hypothetical protein
VFCQLFHTRGVLQALQEDGIHFTLEKSLSLGPLLRLADDAKSLLYGCLVSGDLTCPLSTLDSFSRFVDKQDEATFTQDTAVALFYSLGVLTRSVDEAQDEKDDRNVQLVVPNMDVRLWARRTLMDGAGRAGADLQNIFRGISVGDGTREQIEAFLDKLDTQIYQLAPCIATNHAAKYEGYYQVRSLHPVCLHESQLWI